MNVEENTAIVKTENIRYEPSALVALAIQKDLDIDKLKGLMELQERYDNREAEKSFIRALAEFKKNPPEIIKDVHRVVKLKEGGQFEYDHASLGNVVGTLSKCLAEHGFITSWDSDQQNGKIKVTCYLSHIDGHVKKAWLEAPPDKTGFKNDIQAIASTDTYLQRYTLLKVTGFATNENETDGRLPEDTTPKQPQNAPQQKQKAPGQKQEPMDIGKSVDNCILAAGKIIDPALKDIWLTKAENINNVKQAQAILDAINGIIAKQEKQ